MMDPYQKVLSCFADTLACSGNHGDAAVAFAGCGRVEEALESYQKALLWRELFSLAIQHNMTDDSVRDLADDVAGIFITVSFDIVLSFHNFYLFSSLSWSYTKNF
jgi:hypothetical protein